ncbi:MAG: aminotransferase class III-fold pyridoxal phosphate-dependent enzyme [Candidatus Dadabacteria bacterium]|nr:MAG: aminotransferase class III-fold pyridoxal phosphate-dependent enzyme [Candidatus Dadabacteria bacterium]
MSLQEKLEKLKEASGRPFTEGLEESWIAKFEKIDTNLVDAVEGALFAWSNLQDEEKELLKEDESKVIRICQEGILNFYSVDSVSPYIPIYAKGPWIVTAYGSVVYDTGGYGMLGFGHNPDVTKDISASGRVMANVMTPSFAQKRLVDVLKKKIGIQRGECPYVKFAFMNSGSEAVSVAARVADAHAMVMVGKGGVHEGKPQAYLSLKGSFHGRTYRPALVSHSTRKEYLRYLASFKNRKDLLIVDPNDCKGLESAYREAEKRGIFIEAMFMEPVMGEGNPGFAISREFYDTARCLTKEHGSLLIIDSIQAGLRAWGVLSIIDYPQFRGVEPPDIETFSKAINAGQYPVSAVCFGRYSSGFYKIGIYGNTMTANPAAMDIACAVLKAVDEDIRDNIVVKGKELKEKLEDIARAFPRKVIRVEGTGLLSSMELDERRCKVVGFRGIEERLRRSGLNVIHGGKNSLRFTPHFKITSEEICLIAEKVRSALESP